MNCCWARLDARARMESWTRTKWRTVFQTSKLQAFISPPCPSLANSRADPLCSFGMDLHKVTFPTFVLEPRSMLERITDFMSHPDLIFGYVSCF